jgi:hypothetical protein
LLSSKTHKWKQLRHGNDNSLLILKQPVRGWDKCGGRQVGGKRGLYIGYLECAQSGEGRRRERAKRKKREG